MSSDEVSVVVVTEMCAWRCSPAGYTDYRRITTVSQLSYGAEIGDFSVTAVIVKHGFGLLSVTAKTATRFGVNRNCPC